jgi:hypothetical protein
LFPCLCNCCILKTKFRLPSTVVTHCSNPHPPCSRTVDAPSLPRYAFSCSVTEPQHPPVVRRIGTSFATDMCSVTSTYPQSAYD